MSNTKLISAGVAVSCLSCVIFFGNDVFYCMVSGFLCATLVVTGLNWLKNVDTRRFHRLLTLTGLLLIVSTRHTAMAQALDMAGLKTALSNGLGMIMWFGILAGVIMIIRGILMDRSNGDWKWEILKGCALAGAPTIINVLYTIFQIQGGTLQATFNGN